MLFTGDTIEVAGRIEECWRAATLPRQRANFSVNPNFSVVKCNILKESTADPPKLAPSDFLFAKSLQLRIFVIILNYLSMTPQLLASLYSFYFHCLHDVFVISSLLSAPAYTILAEALIIPHLDNRISFLIVSSPTLSKP